MIDHLRGKGEASRFLAALDSRQELATHPVVVAEVLMGARNRSEQDEIARLFRRFFIVDITPGDCTESLALLGRLRLAHGTGWHDCFIGATSRRIGVAVATLNVKDFQHIDGLEVVRPY